MIISKKNFRKIITAAIMKGVKEGTEIATEMAYKEGYKDGYKNGYKNATDKAYTFIQSQLDEAIKRQKKINGN